MGRDAAIRAASDLGLSLREIASATGLGVETVRRILKAAS
jgi:DNA-binding IclR family transcriptional regulator